MSKRKITRRMTYTTQFRTDAVKRAESGEHVPVVAKDLGINPSTLWNWIAKARQAQKLLNSQATPKVRADSKANSAFTELVQEEVDQLDEAINQMEDRRDVLQRYLEL